jgi:hypothetical protein
MRSIQRRPLAMFASARCKWACKMSPFMERHIARGPSEAISEIAVARAAHKVREALAAEVETVQPAGEVGIDGCYVGGYVKPSNFKENRRDHRLVINQNGKRRVVVAMRERNGRTLPLSR